MVFVSLNEIAPSAHNKGRRSVDKIAFATDRTLVKKTAVYALRISIPIAIARQARFIKGDRVDLLFDQQHGRALVKRVSAGGWTLSTNNKTSSSLTVKVSYRPGVPTVAETVHCDYELVDEGIVFSLPSSVSFEKNMRAE